MKSIFKLMLGAGLAITMVSCGAANDPYYGNTGDGYPTGSYPTNGTVYRTPEGTVYRQGQIYRDTNGNVYQNGRVIRTGDIYGRPGIITDVYRGNTRQNLPPGQAKKVYGGSARDYAPGQVKKRNGYYKKYDDRDYRESRDYKYKKYKKNRQNNNNQ